MVAASVVVVPAKRASGNIVYFQMVPKFFRKLSDFHLRLLLCGPRYAFTEAAGTLAWDGTGRETGSDRGLYGGFCSERLGREAEKT